MKKTFCVVTSVWDGKRDWLMELGQSLDSLILPDGWELVWAVQEDGEQANGAFLSKEFDFCQYESLGVRCGAAVVRNVALSRVPEAHAVTNLDCDDVAQQGLFKSLQILDENENVYWVTGQVDDLLPDGSTLPFYHDLEGFVEAKVAPKMWWENQHLPFHTVGFVARAEQWRSTGGWISLPTMSDDTAATMALTQMWPGFVHREVTALWRRHEMQNSNKNASKEIHGVSWKIIHQRVNAINNVKIGPL
jgi:hypothetical protein